MNHLSVNFIIEKFTIIVKSVLSMKHFIDWIMQMNFNMITKVNQIIAEQGKFDVIHAHDWLVANAAKSIKISYNIN